MTQSCELLEQSLKDDVCNGHHITDLARVIAIDWPLLCRQLSRRRDVWTAVSQHFFTTSRAGEAAGRDGFGTLKIGESISLIERRPKMAESRSEFVP